MAGKAALVTGAGGGIGAAIARLFCEEGASVLLFDVNADLLEKTASDLRSTAAGVTVVVSAGDVTNPAHVSDAVEQAIAGLGGINVLVNNAAIRNHDSIVDSEIDDWRLLMEVNLYGAVNFCKAALPALRASGKASVVNVSSCYGVVGRKGMPIYDATKAALLSLTRTLAFEEAGNGVRANAVCPGGTLTPFTVGRALAAGRKAQEMTEERRTDSLLQRWAKPEEIAYPVLWLASDESSYMTGATLMVDGGLSIM